MTGRELKPLFRKYLQEHLPAFVLKGRLVYLQPVDVLLRAFCFEPSSFDKSFTIECFIQPLFIPEEHLVFNYGTRLGKKGDKWFRPDTESEETIMQGVLLLMQERGIPYLNSIHSPSDLVKMIKGRREVLTLHDLQGIAYSLCYENNDRISILLAFDDLGASLEKNLDRSWAQKMKEQAVLLKQTYNQDANAAKELLNAWALETKAKLGIN